MAAAYTRTDPEETAKSRTYRRHCRGEAAGQLRHLHHAQASGVSERAHAKEVGIPRTTMRSWERRRRKGQGQGVPEFFQTKEGVEWVSRLVWALLFVMSLRCPAGLRCIGEVLELSGLGAIAAGSFGTMQRALVIVSSTTKKTATEQQHPAGPKRRAVPAHPAHELGAALRRRRPGPRRVHDGSTTGFNPSSSRPAPSRPAPSHPAASRPAPSRPAASHFEVSHCAPSHPPIAPPTFACVKDGCSRDCLVYRHGRNDDRGPLSVLSDPADVRRGDP